MKPGREPLRARRAPRRRARRLLVVVDRVAQLAEARKTSSAGSPISSRARGADSRSSARTRARRSASGRASTPPSSSPRARRRSRRSRSVGGFRKSSTYSGIPTPMREPSLHCSSSRADRSGCSRARRRSRRDHPRCRRSRGAIVVDRVGVERAHRLEPEPVHPARPDAILHVHAITRPGLSTR
jgi:hypothetical protein